MQRGPDRPEEGDCMFTGRRSVLRHWRQSGTETGWPRVVKALSHGVMRVCTGWDGPTRQLSSLSLLLLLLLLLVSPILLPGSWVRASCLASVSVHHAPADAGHRLRAEKK